MSEVERRCKGTLMPFWRNKTGLYSGFRWGQTFWERRCLSFPFLDVHFFQGAKRECFFPYESLYIKLKMCMLCIQHLYFNFQ